MRLRGADCRVYLVTDQALCLGRAVRDVVLAAVAAGCGLVQLREKQADTREFVELARALAPEVAARGALLVVNDRVDVALAAGAHGAHVGQSDMDWADARALLGPDAVLGLSVEDMAQARAAEDADVDYLGVSPIHPTPTKPDAIGAWGLEGLAGLRKASRHRLVAIGGIHAGNARAVVRAGADSLAVVSAICSAPDPGASVQQLLRAFRPDTAV